MPRKFDYDVYLYHRNNASMRPEQLCPGNKTPRVILSTWTPGFNEAGAIMPRKLDVPNSLYSMIYLGRMREVGAVGWHCGGDG